MLAQLRASIQQTPKNFRLSTIRCLPWIPRTSTTWCSSHSRQSLRALWVMKTPILNWKIRLRRVCCFTNGFTICRIYQLFQGYTHLQARSICGLTSDPQ